ncbi:MAG: 30S ribosomal protein S20 [Dehalococcoidia bacterium]|nr:30S ribosomal protein S20 [Dehalococcoidia bacterium]
MAHTKSAKKSIRINQERRSRNRSVNSSLKRQVGKAESSIAGGELEPAREAVYRASIALDRAARKGIIHVNNASRRKSRLAKKLKSAFAISG